MKHIRTLITKEWAEVFKNRIVVFTVGALPLLMAALPLGILLSLRGTSFAGGDTTDLPPSMIRACGAISIGECFQVYLLNQFLPLFMMMPLFIPIAIASYSIVGEKSNRTLEPLLATPIKTWELMAGKILASLIPSMVLTWLSATIFIAAVRYAAVSPRVFSTIVSPGWLTVLIACTPLLGLIAIAVMVAISARVNDPRTAQQYSAWLVVPFLAMFFSQITGLVTLSPLIGMIAAIMLAVIAGLATWGATLLFQREAILTRWS